MTRLPWLVPLLFALTVALSGCGYSAVQSGDEEVKAKWAEILDQYTNRVKLVPPLIGSVKAYAPHEREVLQRVAEARARSLSIAADESLLDDEEIFRRYDRFQAALTGTLSRLVALSEEYPQLKADATFRDLEAQLKATTGRIAASRRSYQEAAITYNTTLQSFPASLTAKLIGATARPTFILDASSPVVLPPKSSP